MKKFLAMSRRTVGVVNEEAALLVRDDALQAFRLMRSGSFDQMWSSPDWKGTVIILRALSRKDAIDRLQSLPMVAHGFVSFDLWQLENYDQWSKLFKDEHWEAL